MPKYRATGPDGRVYQVTAPDEATARAHISAAASQRMRAVGYSDIAGGLATLGGGLTMNGWDELQGVMGGVGSALTGGSYQQGYRRAADNTRAQQQIFAARRPYSAPLLSGMGGALPVLASAGAGAIPAGSGALGTAARVATAPGRAAISMAATRPIATGAAVGAAYGAGGHVLSGVTPEERFDPGGVALSAGGGAALGAGLGATSRAVPAVADFVGRQFLTPEQKAARLLQTKVLGPQNMTPDDVRLRAQRIRNSSSGQTGEHVFQAMGPINGPGWRAARAVAQQQGPGQAIAINAARAAKFGVNNASDDLASRAAGELVRDQRAAAVDTGYTAAQGTRSDRFAESIVKNIGSEMERGPVGFADAANMIEQHRRNFFPKAYEDAFLQPPADEAAARALSGQINDINAINWAADELTANPALKERFKNQLGNEEARIISRLERAGSEQEQKQLIAQLEDVRQAAEQLRTIASGQPLNAPLSARAAAMYKRGLDQRAATAGPWTPEGSSYVARGAAFRDNLHSAYPKLAETDAAYAGTKTFRESMDVGRKALNMHPGELDQTIQNMSDDAFDAFLVGLHDDFQVRLANNESGFARKIINNPLFRQRLESVLGKEKAEDLLLRMARETNLEGAHRFVLNNQSSPTAPLTEDMRAFTEGAEEGNIVNDLIAFGQSPTGFITETLASLYDRQRLPGIKNPKTNEALARLLYAPATDANIAKVAAAIDGLPRYGASAQARRVMGGTVVTGTRAGVTEKQRRRRR